MPQIRRQKETEGLHLVCRKMSSHRNTVLVVNFLQTRDMFKSVHLNVISRVYLIDMYTSFHVGGEEDGGGGAS